MVGALADPWVRPIVTNRLSEGRKLDTGNPTPGHIGSDFGRFQFSIWTAMAQIDARTSGRRARLERLNRWRNAIAHQDFVAADLDLGGGRTDLRLGDVTDWRRACDQLAATMDAAMALRLNGLVGRSPW